jgi:hypothetical protein
MLSDQFPAAGKYKIADYTVCGWQSGSNQSHVHRPFEGLSEAIIENGLVTAQILESGHDGFAGAGRYAHDSTVVGQPHPPESVNVPVALFGCQPAV